MRSKVARRSGVLLHPTSFPGPWGIGDLGATARGFVDFLADTRQQLWQILPLGPTADDGSPYSSFASSAGNPLLISIEALADDGMAPAAAAPVMPSSSPVDPRAVRAAKLPALMRASEAFFRGPRLREEYEHFCSERADWLDDYALFMALKATHPGQTWNQWPADLVRRTPAALAQARASLADLVAFHKFTQFAFFRQWSALRDYAHQRGIRIVGDIPFYVAFDSVDVWANPQNFALLPGSFEPRLMAGVPPDYFSANGQLWGNPVYDWDHLQRSGFDWWIQRFRRLTHLVDLVRIDHFRGFQAFWQVPHGETTAINGTWADCPGDRFFHALEHELGHVPVWAEDLGLVTPAVEKLRDDFDFPGMKVLQFGFDEKGAENPYLPFNFPHNCVCYTGTHDNDTTVGWWAGLAAAQRQQVLDYAGPDASRDIHWAMIRLAMSSVAHTVVVPLQDLLGLGTAARMNVPGRADGNWSWRYDAASITPQVRERLRAMTDTYGRAPRFLAQRSGG
ncbi:MAG TPA: 4-alpha-glucanotransferase [Vicinamibacterales bacterium]|nr:4-alpha-glucanotransferase [Vicinamibacterales bacterium]